MPSFLGPAPYALRDGRLELIAIDETRNIHRTSASGPLFGNRCALPAMPIAISDDYARRSVPVIKLQTRRAGACLAMLLNRALS